LKIIKPDWPAPDHIYAATTLRTGGVSSDIFSSFNMALHVGDKQENVLSNRRRLCQMLSLSSEPVWLNQVHGTTVVDASRTDIMLDADASFTQQSDVVCVVMTADCLPILLTDRRGEYIAAIHAGWRSLAGGVIEATVSNMNVKNTDLLAWLGPAISQEFFEVVAEVRDLFLARNRKNKHAFKLLNINTGKWLADLPMLARLTLQKMGINAVYGGSWCTYKDHRRFYSYRRSGKTGRMATLIWKNTTF